MKTGYSVGDVMTRNTETIDSGAKIIEAAKKMSERKIGSLVVIKDGKPIGIVTEQDLARKVVAQGVNPEESLVVEITSDKLHSIAPEKDVYEAMTIMGQKEIKHLPVVVREELQGIISFKDVIALQPDLIELSSFKSAMRR